MLGFLHQPLQNLANLFADKSKISPSPQENSFEWTPDFSPVTSIIRDTGLQSRTFQEAAEVLYEAAPTFPGIGLFLDQAGFRSMSQSVRDLTEPARLGLLNRAISQSVVNPIITRGMTIRTDLIVSEGFKPKATSANPKIAERVQKVLDEYWELNQWDERMFERVFDLGVTGEMVRRVPPLSRKLGKTGNETFYPGKFRCGAIPVNLIRGVAIDPWNYEAQNRIYLQDYGFGPAVNTRDLNLKIICDDRIGKEEFGAISGDCFYLGVNRPPGASRGISDLIAAIDWADLHSQVMINDVERAKAMLNFIWDVTLDGASPTAVKNYAREVKANMIRSGTVRAHNDKEHWDAISPDLKIADTEQLRQYLFKLVWGCLGLPIHWFTEAENVNKASGENMSDPAFAWSRTRRRILTAHLELECRYAIQVAWEAGRLNGIDPEELGCKIVSRDPDRKGYENVGQTWNDIASGLTQFIGQGLLDRPQAAKIVAQVIGTYGFEIDEKLVGDADQNFANLTAVPVMPRADQMSPVDGSNGQNQGPPKAGAGKNGKNMPEDPLEAVMSEAMKRLDQAKREERELRRHY